MGGPQGCASGARRAPETPNTGLRGTSLHIFICEVSKTWRGKAFLLLRLLSSLKSADADNLPSSYRWKLSPEEMSPEL